MTSPLLVGARSVEAEFAAIIARVDPFSEPDYETFEEDEDQPVDDDAPMVDWP
ncbi:hypothetical protein [Streptomonospora wellingtoniae]|uniref:Uncharacterized protein n=1 Tax=Streptomonospora wellingtoniae TaxID=3075544 RepID=A0ABU2KXE4_9ACTN|nr:hypothetical protein [Streptomonospora sp. DSM 45055]MDT0303979.1 hypothetical protein [Streptomonospora sp. DSM 45055]